MPVSAADRNFGPVASAQKAKGVMTRPLKMIQNGSCTTKPVLADRTTPRMPGMIAAMSGVKPKSRLAARL